MRDASRRPRVVIVGGGFGGLWAARTLSKAPVEVLVVDRNNYHTFLALLYQVAAAELEAEDIAYPIRSALWKYPNAGFTLSEVLRIDAGRQVLETEGRPISYDYLIVAAGSMPFSFGVPGVDEHAFFLKSLEQGVALRNHIICCFEKALQETDEERLRRLLTFTIVGGGPTGVEYAGALSELVHGPLRKDYPGIDFRKVRIALLEATDQLHPGMPEKVYLYTRDRLRRMGIEVFLNARVAEVREDGVSLADGSSVPCHTTVWTAGVRGERIAQASGLPVNRGGRVPVAPTLQVPGLENVYVIGDLAWIEEQGAPLPMVAQVAIQSGVTAARNVLRQIEGETPLPFRYHDKGSMITIGRNAAGAVIGGMVFTGLLAWLIWLIIHLFNLIGFRNRLLVLINWAWDYVLYERAVRFVFPSHGAWMARGLCAPDRPVTRIEERR
ncbi:MAG: NAD(P)/FAD-dependent oxidoreductase [Deltaproteobacteria bacterium]|nr:NAD(P)/FAD-dependent oxidoreductase [Deltaproteobacteria bacterium]